MTIADKLTQIAENQQKVYDAGFSDGLAHSDGSNVDSYYDTFWDSFQKNGNRDNYVYAFYKWDDVSYNPKYVISGIVGNCFRESKITSTKVDIVASGNAARAFYDSSVIEITSIDITNVTSTEYMFNGCTLLQSITFVGEIRMGIDMHYSPLNKESIERTINALSNTTSDLTIIFSDNAIISAFGSIDADEWTTLKNTKSNWIISCQ